MAGDAGRRPTWQGYWAWGEWQWLVYGHSLGDEEATRNCTEHNFQPREMTGQHSEFFMKSTTKETLYSYATFL